MKKEQLLLSILLGLITMQTFGLEQADALINRSKEFVNFNDHQTESIGLLTQNDQV